MYEINVVVLHTHFIHCACLTTAKVFFFKLIKHDEFNHVCIMCELLGNLFFIFLSIREMIFFLKYSVLFICFFSFFKYFRKIH